MLQIKITGVDISGNLTFDPEPPHEVKRDQAVHWVVDDKSGTVAGIYDIHWKNKSGSTNIFSHNPPQFEGSDPVAKQWKAIANKKKADAPDYAQYHYAIYWEDKDGNQHAPDPIISIKPSLLTPEDAILIMAVGAVAALSMVLLLKAFKHKTIRDYLPSKFR